MEGRKQPGAAAEAGRRSVEPSELGAAGRNAPVWVETLCEGWLQPVHVAGCCCC